MLLRALGFCQPGLCPERIELILSCIISGSVAAWLRSRAALAIAHRLREHAHLLLVMLESAGAAWRGALLEQLAAQLRFLNMSACCVPACSSAPPLCNLMILPLTGSRCARFPDPETAPGLQVLADKAFCRLVLIPERLPTPLGSG